MSKNILTMLIFAVLTPTIISGCASTDTAKKDPTVSSGKTQSSSVKPVISPNESEGKEYEALRQQNMIFFAFDNSDINSQGVETLRAHAAYLIKHPDTKVKIEGHCDERGTPEYNIALGERRAQSTKKYLQRLGVASQQMSVVSYGEEKPLVAEHNRAAYAKNRRAVIVY